MKPRLGVGAILINLALMGCSGTRAEELLPGMTYYPGPEKLSGRLAFLVQHDYTVETNTIGAASIYEFSLERQRLQKLADAPVGLFISSDDGTVFCVNLETNVFVYSAAARTGRTVVLEAAPLESSPVGDHVLFALEETDTSRHTVRSWLIDYNVRSEQTRRLVLPGASRWQYENCGGVVWPPGQTQLVHFYYKGYGRRLVDGKDYPSGYYSLSLSTGGISGPVPLAAGEDDRRYIFKASDGRYVFFRGNGAPTEGFTLVSSPQNIFDAKLNDPEAKSVKVLHTFSRIPALNHGMYLLAQMSPDGDYALVRLEEPIWRKAGGAPGYVNTYFLVDALTGKTRIFLKDEAEKATRSSVSPAFWVSGPEGSLTRQR